MDRNDIIGELVKRTGVKITPDDPIFLFLEIAVLLNTELVKQNEAAIERMEKTTSALVDNITVSADAVNKSVLLLNKKINAVADARSDDKLKMAIVMALCVLAGVIAGIAAMSFR